MANLQNICFICNAIANSSQQGLNQSYTCKKCGSYLVPNGGVPRFNEKLRPIISGYVREHQTNHTQFHLTQEVVDKIGSMPVPTIDEKIFKLMSWIEKQTSYPGESIKSIFDNQELVSICYAKDMNEINYFLEHLKNKNLLLATDQYNKNYKITVEGFNYLGTAKKIINSNLCFCAMSFEKQHQEFYDKFIKPAVSMAGFDIKRVDEDPHNDSIVDKIVALIRQSKFLIADLSGNKHGVYYESGFAKGLERPVIFTCEEDYFDQIHFDVKHLNFLKWNKNNINDAIEKLRWRIESTVGRGSLSPE